MVAAPKPKMKRKAGSRVSKSTAPAMEGPFTVLVEELRGQFKVFGEALQAFRGHVDERFDRVEGRLDKVEGRLDKVEGRLDKVEGRLGNVEGRLGNVEREVGLLKDAVRTHSKELQRIEPKIDDHDVRIEKLERAAG